MAQVRVREKAPEMEPGWGMVKARATERAQARSPASVPGSLRKMAPARAAPNR
jgi:hypothetical protein